MPRICKNLCCAFILSKAINEIEDGHVIYVALIWNFPIGTFRCTWHILTLFRSECSKEGKIRKEDRKKGKQKERKKHDNEKRTVSIPPKLSCSVIAKNYKRKQERRGGELNAGAGVISDEKGDPRGSKG